MAPIIARGILFGMLRSSARWLPLLLAPALALTLVPLRAAPQDRTPNLAPFVPTPQEVVDRMLRLASVTKDDVVYDLGSGDGRIVISAAQQYGARGVGVDIDPLRIAESEANAKRAGVSHLVTFKRQDALQTDVSDATVVTLYLLSASNLKLRPILTRQLKPGARIVAHAFGMGDWKPARVDTFTDSSHSPRTLYLWIADGTVRP
ncbi:MAG: cyclopropane-fatty-acyl-phospholipid synthase family protein [Vicinamibacterales bacterium]